MSGLQFKTDGQDRRAHDGARHGSWQVQSGHGRVRVTGMCAAPQKRKPAETAMARVCTTCCRQRSQSDLKAFDVKAFDVKASDVKASDVKVSDVKASDVKARARARVPVRAVTSVFKTGADIGTLEANALGSSNVRPESGARSRVSSICCPLQFACEEFASKIEANRAHANQRWIFNLIRGEFSSNEVVFLDEAEWMLVQGSSHLAQEMRYLVIFKDTGLQTIRDLRQRHLPLLLDVREKVSRFVARRHAAAPTFRQYFHYMPSVFQLHMHVCCNATVDMNRTQDVRCVMRNLQAVDTWYRDALILFSAPRSARTVAAPVSARCGGDKRDCLCI
jgi:hypothetical protein